MTVFDPPDPATTLRPPLPTVFGSADLFVFDPSTLTWTELTGAVQGVSPSARHGHGFTSEGGRLYVHSGWTGLSGEPEGDLGVARRQARAADEKEGEMWYVAFSDRIVFW